MDSAKAHAQGLHDSAKENMQSAVDSAHGQAQSMADSAQSAGEQAHQSALGSAQSAMGSMQTASGSAQAHAQGVLDSAQSSAQDAGSNAQADAGNFGQAAAASLKDFGWDSLQSSSDALKAGVSSAADSAHSAVQSGQDAAASHAESAQAAMDSAKAHAQGLHESAKENMQSAADTAQSHAQSMATSAQSAAQQAHQSAMGAASSAAESMRNRTVGSQQEAEAEAAAAEEKGRKAHSGMVKWWILLMGIVSGIAVVAKNVCAFASTIFQVIDDIQLKVDESIDTLQKELEGDVKRMLEEAVKGKGKMVEMAMGTASKPIFGELSKSIDKAQKELDLHPMLPWPVASRSNIFALAMPPCLLVVLLNGLVCYLMDPPPMFWAEGRRLVEVPTGQDVEDFVMQSKWLMINIALNALWGFLVSWPVVRFCMNSSLGLIQGKVNDYLQVAVRKNIPGGVESIQKMVDTAQDPMGAIPGGEAAAKAMAAMGGAGDAAKGAASSVSGAMGKVGGMFGK